MLTRCTKDGRLVIRFVTEERVPENGHVLKVNGRDPEPGTEFDSAVLTFLGRTVIGTNVSVEEALVVVWRQPVRKRFNTRTAELVGGAATAKDLEDLYARASQQWPGLMDVSSGRWITLTEARLLFQEATLLFDERC